MHTTTYKEIVLQDEPCFLFKMFTHGFRNGVELVKRMIEGDLKTSWVMFDHIKRVHD
jgi:hypothetical protein